MDVTGKKALIFGGTSGIGLATAKQLKGKGAEVVVISRDPSKAGDLDGIKAVACDVRDTDALSEVFSSEAPFDILISAATGGSRAAGPFLQMDIEGYRNSFDKLWGYTNCVRFGTEYLSETGVIVLVSGSPARRAKVGQSAIASCDSYRDYAEADKCCSSWRYRYADVRARIGPKGQDARRGDV